MGDKFVNINKSKIINRSNKEVFTSKNDDTTNKLTPEINKNKTEYLDLVSKGRIEDVLKKLLEDFKVDGDKFLLNEIIMYNSRFAQLKTQKNLNTISLEYAERENAIITHALIDFIQRIL